MCASDNASSSKHYGDEVHFRPEYSVRLGLYSACADDHPEKKNVNKTHIITPSGSTLGLLARTAGITVICELPVAVSCVTSHAAVGLLCVNI